MKVTGCNSIGKEVNAEILQFLGMPVSLVNPFLACSAFASIQWYLFVYPGKINIERNNGGVEDHGSFQFGDF